jgi:hypothetical protein
MEKRPARAYAGRGGGRKPELDHDRGHAGRQPSVSTATSTRAANLATTSWLMRTLGAGGQRWATTTY